MREFFQIINEYPWTTFWLAIFVLSLAVIMTEWRFFKK